MTVTDVRDVRCDKRARHDRGAYCLPQTPTALLAMPNTIGDSGNLALIYLADTTKRCLTESLHATALPHTPPPFPFASHNPGNRLGFHDFLHEPRSATTWTMAVNRRFHR